MSREDLRRDVIARLQECLIDVDRLGGWPGAGINVNQAIEDLKAPPEKECVG